MGNILKLIGCILLCESAGVIGAIFTARSVRTWYLTLQKPSFNPPGWVFGPVWTVLYVLMGIALYLIWQKGSGSEGYTRALVLFFTQLVLNAAWSFIFFGARAVLPAFIEITLLWILIVGTIVAFREISPAAAWLLVPYVLWVTFAAILNYSIWRLNSGAL
jgi:benzodiazapine receptor